MTVSRRPAHERYRRGLMSSIVNNSSAFGFSVMITSAFGMLGTFHGNPSAFEVTLFALGAVLAVSIIETVASKGFRRRPHAHPEEVLLLGTAANLVSVAAALAVTYSVGRLLPAPAVWPVAPLLTAAMYVLVEAAELAVAEGVQQRVFGDPEAEAEE